MALKDLIENIGQENLAEDIDQDVLAELGVRIKRQYDEDLASMKDWCEMVDKGLDLMKQEYKTKSHPWDGASNFKSPLMTQASIAFGDKASLEILRSKNLVKADIIGKDKSGEKGKLADRITEAMNYQVNYQMDNWRKEQKRLLYVNPNVGCMFKEVVYDSMDGKPSSNIIQYPDFAVNQATTDMDNARSFTKILDVGKNGMFERQASGTWLDIDLYPEDADGDEGSNEAASTKSANDNDERFLEQQCWADLDKDGYEEPYTVTIHENTMTVLRIVARYNFTSFTVKDRSGQVSPLVDLIKDETIRAKLSGMPLPDFSNISGLELVKITPFQNIIKYGFIPSPDGSFLDLGYAHLLGAITQAINTTTNQLTDSGTARNMGGGYLAKGFRKKMGPLRFKPGEYKETNIAARDLQTGILPNPNPEPSAVLFALNEKLQQQGLSFASIIDVSGQIQANTAPTTALAIIQEALISVSALMGRILDSMSEEFQALFDINKTTFDQKLYTKILDEEADVRADFNNESLDIQPTASPEMSSKLQRIQLSTVEMEMVPAVINAGGNPMPIVKGFFERIGSDKIDEIFPEQPTDQQAQETAKFREAQELENQIAMENLKLTQLQTEILMREQDRLDADTQRKIEETSSEIKKNLSEIILNLEKAESEDVKNNVSKYTAQINGHIATIKAIGEENARAANLRVERQAQQTSN